jgi:spoIIIJ-associated protein
MEWVETTGRTVEDAKDAALDQLGVDEQDAEFEVLEEPRTGLFGRTRGEARVRARVKPTQPRPKAERRDRRQKAGGGRNGRGGDNRKQGGPRSQGNGAPAAPAAVADPGEPEAEAPASAPSDRPASEGERPRRNRRGGRGGGGRRPDGADGSGDEERIEMSEEELTAQGDVVKGFVVDLLDAFGLDGEVAVSTAPDDGALELAVSGGDLGLLIGPKGQTLQAIQELSRSVLQRQLPGETHARVRIDVGGYRQRRREALERFVRDIAEQVKSTGDRKALEPMSPPDRKVVHDTVNEIEGVTTISEGEDARRRVVILPA